VRGSKIWHPHLIPLPSETVSQSRKMHNCHSEQSEESNVSCHLLKRDPSAQDDIATQSLERGSLITSLPVTNQRRFLFVSAAVPRASLRYCKHKKNLGLALINRDTRRVSADWQSTRSTRLLLVHCFDFAIVLDVDTSVRLIKALKIKKNRFKPD
jgi:hypothetical protein